MHDWRKIILKQKDTMQSAIDALNNEALRIVMVVDDDEKLVGTVTDGDIRRGLIDHLTVDSMLSDFMHKDPTVASVEQGRDEILTKMKEFDLLQIPILDDKRRVVGLETLLHLLKKPKYENVIFLMAGGFGKRLRPLTNKTPKPLLNVGNKPILETILEQFVESGFQNFYISTHYKADMVEEYFGNGEQWGVSIQYINEKIPLGTAGALGLLPDNLPDLPVIMMNGDLLTKVDFKNLLEFHKGHGGVATMCVREYDFKVPYGVVEFSKQSVSAIIEKPVHNFFINAGIYVLEPSLVKSVVSESYIDMPELLEQNIKNNKKVNMYPIHEYWLDIGQIKDYEQAQIDIDN